MGHPKVFFGTYCQLELSNSDYCRFLGDYGHRGAGSADRCRFHLLPGEKEEENGNEKLMGVLIHNRIKKYAPMFDKVGYIY